MNRNANEIAPPKPESVRVNYKIISFDSVDGFNERMEELIIEGWQIDGELIFGRKNDYCVLYTQRFKKFVK